jgi:cholesterol transport system auxiliary component
MFVARVPAVLCLLAAGCLGLSREYPEKHEFVLEAPAHGEAKGTPAQGVLRVNIFRVGPICEQNELVRRTGDVEYESDFYNEWFVPPGAMLTSAFGDWLSSAGVFAHVITAAAGVDATVALGGLVTTLYGDYRTEQPKAVLGVEVGLVSEDAAPRILLQRSYRKEVEIPNQSAEALVRGLNEALRLILVDLEADLRKLPAE